MERLVCFLTIFSLFGSSISVCKWAFRDLSRKVELIRTSLQQEIGDLKFEVLDLKNQLETERTKTNRLEELLNGTGALTDIDTSTVEDVDRGESKDLTSQAGADIFAMVMTAYKHEKERARRFETTVTQKITKVSETTANFRSDIEKLRLSFETVDDGAQRSVRNIEDIQNELTNIRGEANARNDEFADLRETVENVTNRAQESARDIEDINNQLTNIHDEAAAIKGEIADLQHDLLQVHAEVEKSTKHVKKGQNCGVLYAEGTTQSGVYAISPDKRSPFDVYCDMTGDGWTVIQRRIDGTVNFNRTWDEYVGGFGVVNGEHWLGLEKIHRLSKDGAEIYFDIENYDGTREYAHYKNFTVHDAKTLYKMNVDATGYDGSINEGFSNHNDREFSTYDKDNDATLSNCALKYGGRGGWWYRKCATLGYLNSIFGKKEVGGISYRVETTYFYIKTVTLSLRRGRDKF